MPQHVIDRIESFMDGGQIIIWLKDEQTGATEDDQGLSYCVRITLMEAPGWIGQFLAAYAKSMQSVATNLAAGGCRECRNERKIYRDGKWKECPKCIPRAEERLRKLVFGLGRRNR